MADLGRWAKIMKTNLTLLLFAVGITISISGAEPKPSVMEEERLRESQAAYHVIEAVLVAPDMTFKMPVLTAAFRDTPEWEQRLQHLIGRESWEFAKVTFIHFYWKHVSKKDRAFMERMLVFARVGLSDLLKSNNGQCDRRYRDGSLHGLL